jgi:hypothetical protein
MELRQTSTKSTTTHGLGIRKSQEHRVVEQLTVHVLAFYLLERQGALTFFSLCICHAFGICHISQARKGQPGQRSQAFLPSPGHCTNFHTAPYYEMLYSHLHTSLQPSPVNQTINFHIYPVLSYTKWQIKSQELAWC